MTVLGTLIAVLAISQSGPQKATLPNGAVIYAESMDGAKGFALHLFVSAMGAKEQDGQQGFRHLLEHLVAKGRSRDLAAKLESRGLTLTADTLRDGIRFEIEGASQDVAFAIAALDELLTLRDIQQEEIDKEVRIIGQERPTRSNAARLASGLWKQAFGESDLIGTDAEIAKATPELLKKAHAELFRPESMAVAIVGDIDRPECMKALAALIGPLAQKGPATKVVRTVIEQTREGVVPDAHGAGRAVAIGSMSRAESLAVIAAGLSIANEIPGAQLVFTPTAIGGLVCLVHPTRQGFDDLDRLVTSESARLYTSGIVALRLWAQTADELPREKARMFGQMLSAESYFRTEDLKTRAAQVSQSDFVAALQRLRTRQSVRVGGVR